MCIKRQPLWQRATGIDWFSPVTWLLAVQIWLLLDEPRCDRDTHRPMEKKSRRRKADCALVRSNILSTLSLTTDLWSSATAIAGVLVTSPTESLPPPDVRLKTSSISEFSRRLLWDLQNILSQICAEMQSFSELRGQFSWLGQMCVRMSRQLKRTTGGLKTALETSQR